MKPARLVNKKTLNAGLVGLLLVAGGLAVSAVSADNSQSNANTTASTVANQKDKGPIKIGFIVGITGVGADPGQDMVDGIKLYLDQSHHRIAGRPVELIVENDGGDPATSMAKMKKLVEEDKVQILDGVVKSNIGYALAPYTDKYRVPMVYPITSGDDLTKRKHFDWIVRTGWSASQPSHPFGEWVFKTLKYKRIACIAADYALGWEVVGGFQRSFEDAGGQIVQKLWVPVGFTDYSQVLSQLRKDADAVFVVAFGQAAELLPEQYQQFGPKLPVIASGITFDEAILRHQGDQAVDAISVLHYSGALDTPANRHFVKDFQAKYHVDPSYYAEGAYTSGIWIRKAVEAIKGDVEDKDKLLSALKKVVLADAPRGPLKLDDRSSAIENVYVRKVKKVNGRLQNVVIETFPNVSQFWKYNPDQFLKQPPYSREYPPCSHCDR